LEDAPGEPSEINAPKKKQKKKKKKRTGVFFHVSRGQPRGRFGGGVCSKGVTREVVNDKGLLRKRPIMREYNSKCKVSDEWKKKRVNMGTDKEEASTQGMANSTGRMTSI